MLDKICIFWQLWGNFKKYNELPYWVLREKNFSIDLFFNYPRIVHFLLLKIILRKIFYIHYPFYILFYRYVYISKFLYIAHYFILLGLNPFDFCVDREAYWFDTPTHVHRKRWTLEHCVFKSCYQTCRATI